MIDVNYKRSSSSNKTILTSECIAEQNFTSSQELSNEINLAENVKYVSLERRFLDFLGVSHATTVINGNLFHNLRRSSTNETDLSGMNINNLKFSDHFSGYIG